jgi:hypothetical protein
MDCVLHSRHDRHAGKFYLFYVCRLSAGGEMSTAHGRVRHDTWAVGVTSAAHFGVGSVWVYGIKENLKPRKSTSLAKEQAIGGRTDPAK